jgi:hypothetical protein
MSLYDYEKEQKAQYDSLRTQLLARPLNLGGTSTGGGGPTGGFTGYLPQTRVSYDASEIASSGITNSGSLKDNLNHIRLRLQELENATVSGIGGLTVKEVDNNPSVFVGTIVFPNDTLTDNGGGVVTYKPISTSGAGTGDVIGPSSAVDGHLVVFDGTSGKLVKGGGVPTGGGGYDYILIRDEKSKNTPGGDFASPGWQPRILNTEVMDTGNHASISSNQITLAAGTYRANIICTVGNVGGHQARLWNISDDTLLLLGTSQFSHVTDLAQNTASIIMGRFTLTDTKVIEVQHAGTSFKATSGFGYAANIGVEIYTVVELIRDS